MAFANAKQILSRVSGLTAAKLLLLLARRTRPALAPLCSTLLKPFVHHNEIELHYTEQHRALRVAIQEDDEVSDLHSVLEVVVRDVYPLDPKFTPDVVIDGGGNIGLFTLKAAAFYPSASIVVCEPLPRNLSRIERHLALNKLSAEILPICLGGAPGSLPFYCREANSSSFDADKPYTHVLSVEVVTLRDILRDHPAARILIKLDIEGAECDVLEAFVPGEDRAVVVLGELHNHTVTRPRLERIFASHNWSLRFGDMAGDDISFEAHSPAAQAFIAR